MAKQLSPFDKLILVGLFTLGFGLLIWLLISILRPQGQWVLVKNATPDPRHPADKHWKEMPDNEVKHFFPLLAERADALSEFAYKTHAEFTKYLFAANAGAAAGLFTLFRETGGERLHAVAFYLFIVGVFFVGVAHFSLSSWAGEASRGATDDANAWGQNQITVRDTDARHSARRKSWKTKAAGIGVLLSFVSLLAGGIAAAIPFSKLLWQ